MGSFCGGLYPNLTTFCGVIVKCSLFILTFFILFMGGLLILAAGGFIHYQINKYSALFEGGNEKTATIVTICIGIFITLLSVFGTVGTVKNNKYMIRSYAVLVLILLLAEIALGIAGYVERGKLKDTLRKEMKTTLKVYGQEGKEGGGAKHTWNILQENFQCCGVSNYTDYTGPKGTTPSPKPTTPGTKPTTPGPKPTTTEPKPTKLVPKKTTPGPKTTTAGPKPTPFHYILGKGMAVPESCKCDPSKIKDKKICDTTQEGNIYTKGCYQGLLDFLQGHMGLAMGIGLGLGLTQLLMVILAGVIPMCIKGEHQEEFKRMSGFGEYEQMDESS